MCESNLSDDVYDKVTMSSITGVILSADLGVFREIAPTRGGAISWNSQIRTEMTPVILLLFLFGLLTERSEFLNFLELDLFSCFCSVN